ncbi:nucleoside deaminase [Paenibacillus oceani]|uniref:Nucleoside deaminase n=1 Tax=Paenibacillus oceani TaxID=2772510 RepID=A0A927CHW5_9BACL|nr:nucleoside deaminase [Paenibacillus oceani]MBD2866918.1 nucleoside deaminase [Paenibacillus oceani]
MNQHQQWLEQAIRLAELNVGSGGGPFAALVVKDGRIVGRGVNGVHLDHDPTAHAELLAIREACIHLETTDLSDCTLYASGEPCPMCMGTIYWARPGSVYYACSKQEAADATAFGDPLDGFYQEMLQPSQARSINMRKLESGSKLAPFYAWRDMQSE